MNKTIQKILDYLQTVPSANMYQLFALGTSKQVTKINQTVGELLEAGILEKVESQNVICIRIKQ